MALTALYDLPAPAKLNLFLHVVGRRADGYHLLQSVFVPIDWADQLHLERRADGRLSREDLGPPLPDDDLCLRAARALQAASGTRWGAHIAIHKQVPAGAGMGGGSSDAATVLIALNRLWGLGLGRAELSAIGLRLGADVPFFLGTGPAFVEGVGERLTPMAVPALPLVVVKPPQSLPTAAIFGHPALRRDTEPVIVLGFPDSGAQVLADREEPGATPHHAPSATRARGSAQGLQWPEAWGAVNGGFGRNDLQPAAEALCPAVAEACRWLRQRHGNGRMTGSGSAAFAFAGGKDGDAASSMATFPAGDPTDLPPGWVGRHCRSLERLPLAGWLDG